MKTKNLLVGELVRVIGKSGKFRYVKKNIVRSVKSGRVYSVRTFLIVPNVYLITLVNGIVLISISAMYLLFAARIIQLLIIKN